MKMLSSLLFFALFSSQLWAQVPEALPSIYRNMLKYEQHYNDRFENLLVFASIKQNDMNPKYLPENEPLIPLTSMLVPKDQLTIINSSGSEELLSPLLFEKDGKSFVRFLIHPEALDFYPEELMKYGYEMDFEASPTSSHRSMIAWKKSDEAHPMSIKLTINREIGESLRLLTNGQMTRAAAVSYLMKDMDVEGMAKKGHHFIDEPVHVWLKAPSSSTIRTGFTVRQMPTLPECHELIPMFGLYSLKDGTPRILEMIRASGLDAKTYIRTRLIGPMISNMVELAFSEGLIGDLHEQNVLVHLNEKGQLVDFYYRDLGGFDLNPELRAAVGKDLSFLPAELDPKYFKSEKADLIEKVTGYLMNSNFFALRRALANFPEAVSKDWVDTQVMNHLSAEIFLKTGEMARTESTLKTAITKYINQSRSLYCKSVLQ